MKKSYFFLVVLLLAAISAFTQNTYYVATTGDDGNDGSLATPWLTINYAISQVAPGDIIEVAAGTFNEALNITKNLTINGQGVDVTIVDHTGTSGYNNAGVYILANGVNLKNITVTGNPASSTPRYGLKVGTSTITTDDVVLENVKVHNSYRTGFDIARAKDITLDGVISVNNGGAGIFMSNTEGADLIDITTDNNPWTGVSIATRRDWPGDTYDIIFSGTNSFGESGSKNGGLQLESDELNIISWSNNIADNKDITFNAADFAYTLSGPTTNTFGVIVYAPYFRFYQTLAQAQAAAGDTPDHVNPPRYIRDANTSDGAANTNFYVYDNGYMTIQAAVDHSIAENSINIAAGDYDEDPISLNKALTLLGPNAGTPGASLGRAAEARVVNTKITVTAAATIDGFEIYQTDDNADAVLVQAAATVKNSVIKREGVNANIAARGITTAVSTTGYTIEDNLFTGDESGGFFSGHKTWNSGIYLNGGSGTISGNTFENCRTAINADDFNSGITITGNTFQTCGTYMSFGGTTPTNGQYTISGNELYIDWADPINNWLPSAMFNNSNVATTFRIDATGNTFGGVATTALTLDQKYHLEARMVHRGRIVNSIVRNGVIDYINGEQIVFSGNTTIQSAIDAASEGNAIYISPGTYSENKANWVDIELFKSLSIFGAGSGQTIIEFTGKQHGLEIRPDGTGTVHIEGVAFTKPVASTKSADWGIIIGETGGTFTSISFEDVEMAWAAARNIHFQASGVFNAISFTDCNIHNGGTWGLSVNGNIGNLTINNSHFDNHGWLDPSHGIGFDLANPSAITALNVSGSTFNNNTSKGINLVKATNAAFENIEASYNSGAASGGFGVSLWEWAGTSSTLTFTNAILTNNSTDGFLIGSETGKTVSGVSIAGSNLSNNGRAGLFVYRASGWGDGVIEDISVNTSIITGNGSYGVGVIFPYEIVDATCNYWGTMDPATIATMITTGVATDPFNNATLDDCTGHFPFTNDNTGVGYLNMGDAIADANDGDHISINNPGNSPGITVNKPGKKIKISNESNGDFTFEGASPALTVIDGDVEFEDGVTFTTDTDDPTILVTGGSLKLRNCTIEESTGFDQTAILVTGGALDAGVDNTTDPGHNTFIADGLGKALNVTGGTATAIANYWGSLVATSIDYLVDGTSSYDPWCNYDFSRCDFGLTEGPITQALTWNPVPPGAFSYPIRVLNFQDVGAVSLKLTFNPSILDYQDNFTAHASFPGMMVNEESPGVIKISWQGTTIASLPDNTEILLLDFVSSTGSTLTTWVDDDGGQACEYADGNTLLPFIDTPTGDYYIGGFVTDMSVTFSRDYDLNTITANVTGGASPYTYSWSGPAGFTGQGTNTITPVEYSYGNYYLMVTDDVGASVTVFYYYGPVHNLNTDIDYETINEAISATATLDNHVITVDPGTYEEDVYIDKSLDIRGPNYNISPNTGSRVGEAVIYPATSSPYGEIMQVKASDVSINGFTINGDNPNLTSGYLGTNGADLDAAEAVTVYDYGVGDPPSYSLDINNLHVTNNIIKNLTYFGVTIFGWYNYANPPSSGHLVSDNLFQDMGTYDDASGIDYWGGGVLIYNDMYTRIVNNVMTNVRLGIQTGNFHDPNPGDVIYQVIDNNTIQTRRLGIFYNLHTGNPVPLTLSNNVITALANANESQWDGIVFSSLSEAIGVATNNTINGAGLSVPSQGYEIWNVKNNAPVSISGGTVSNVDKGIFANNYEGYNSDAGNGAHGSVSGVTFNAGTGVHIYDSPNSTTHAAVNMTVNNCSFSSGTTGIKFEETLPGTVGGTITDNIIQVLGVGIDVQSYVTTDNTLTIAGNDLTMSQITGTPNAGISLNNISGDEAAIISGNDIGNDTDGPFYGYTVYNLNTTPVTDITGGVIKNVMQGIAAFNVNLSAVYAPSDFTISGVTMSDFDGDHPTLPDANFHAGVYTFTGSTSPATGAGITLTLDNVSVDGTGNIQMDCAGLSFNDFSGQADIQDITVNECTVSNNLNRGINARGTIQVDVNASTLTENGSDANTTNGSAGFGITAFALADVTVDNCFITNPATSTSLVSALFTFNYGGTFVPGPGSIAAGYNSLDQNSNGYLANNAGGTLFANCNWWGSDVFDDISPLINGDVDYIPWLDSGDELDPDPGAGFDPAGDCLGNPLISGTLKYNNSGKTPMNGVTMSLRTSPTTGEIATATTDGSGNYTFDDIDMDLGTYYIVPNSNPRTPGSINSTDAAQANTWGTVSSFPIEHVKFLAGDVVVNEPLTTIINSFDAQKIQRRFVYGINETIDRDPWVYWFADGNGAYIIDNTDPNRLVDVMEVTLGGANVTRDIYGQVACDFNGSYVWSGTKAMMAGILLNYDDTWQVGAGMETELPLRMVYPAELGAASVMLTFPSDMAGILDVTMKDNNGRLDWAVNGNELRIGWNSPQPLAFAAGETLFTLHLKTSESFVSGQVLRLELVPDPANELANASLNTIPDAELSIDVLEASATGIPDMDGADGLALATRPNPFKEHTTLSYTLPFDGRVTLAISDMLGRQVAQLAGEYQSAGEYSVKLDAIPLQPGIYYATLTLQTGSGDIIRTIKLVRNR